MWDIISIGDATIDTLMEIDDAAVNCALKKDQCQLCLNYGDKIVVNHLQKTVAGNAANNAVGSARLGLHTAYCGIVGADDNGQWICDKLHDEHVALDYVTQQKNGSTNASTVINFQGERTILVYHAPRKYTLPKLSPSRMIYYTSVGEHHEPYNSAISTYIKKTGSLLAYNPGSHQIKAGYNVMKPILELCEIIFVNKEEAARILGKKSTIPQLLHGLHATGPRIVVITDGPQGSYAFDGEHSYHMDITKSPVVERTGAGDAYATAFLAAIHYEHPIPVAMCWGTYNSASVIGKIGPQAGLLSKNKILLQTKKFPLKAIIL